MRTSKQQNNLQFKFSEVIFTLFIICDVRIQVSAFTSVPYTLRCLIHVSKEKFTVSQEYCVMQLSG